MKILVDTDVEKGELMAASRVLHDMRDIDLRTPMLNTLAHLYLAPDLIEVRKEHIHDFESTHQQIALGLCAVRWDPDISVDQYIELLDTYEKEIRDDENTKTINGLRSIIFDDGLRNPD